MKRKIPAPRNPFAAAAKMKKAGAHRKSNKAARRAENMKYGSVAQMAEATGFYPVGREFDARRSHHQ